MLPIAMLPNCLIIVKPFIDIFLTIILPHHPTTVLKEMTFRMLAQIVYGQSKGPSVRKDTVNSFAQI